MRDRRGTAGRLSGLAGGVAAAVRRRQQAREPRVVLFNRDGRPWVLAPAEEAQPEIVALADRMIDLVAAELATAPAGPVEEPALDEQLPPLAVEDAQLFPGPGLDERPPPPEEGRR